MRPENIEFIALFEASEWSQAEAARRLRTTPATISRYLTPDEKKQIAPGRPVLELFKFILGSERPGALTAVGTLREQSMEEWERKVIEDLRWLHKGDREKVLEAVRAIVSALPKRAPVDYLAKPLLGVSSEIADVATGSQAAASELARRETQEQQRKRATGEPSERKRERGRGERKGLTRKPESPK